MEVSAGYANLHQLLKDKYVPTTEYHDYYIFSLGPSATQTVNFTTYFGARATPDSHDLKTAQELVWVFGGSTMQNLETEDQLSIANNIGVELNKSGVPARVINFGTGGFQSSLESIKFQDLLRRVPESERPTTAVFYDGFNDAMYSYLFGAGSMQLDLSLKMRDLVEGHYGRLLLYSLSQFLSQHSVFWDKYIGHRINYSLYLSTGSINDDPKKLQKTVSTYVANVRMTGAVCHELKIRCLFILQPLVVTKFKLTAEEQKALHALSTESITFVKEFYRLSSLALRDLSTFADLSHMLDDSVESDFYDLGHTSPFTGKRIGREIARQITRVRQRHLN
jgi:hypothetical protein